MQYLLQILHLSTSAWLLSPLECSPQKQMAERSASVTEDELCEKCIIKQWLNSVFTWYHELSKPRVCVIMPQPSASADNTDLGFDNSWYHAQPHPIIVYDLGHSYPQRPHSICSAPRIATSGIYGLLATLCACSKSSLTNLLGPCSKTLHHLRGLDSWC